MLAWSAAAGTNERRVVVEIAFCGVSRVQPVDEHEPGRILQRAQIGDCRVARCNDLLQPIALASEIASLPDFHGFLTLPGTPDVFRVRYQRKQHPRIAPPFIG